MRTGIRCLWLLTILALFALVLAACSSPNLGSNIKSGDLERTQEVWVSDQAPTARGRIADWHVETDRKPVAEFTRMLSTAKRIEGRVDYRPGGDGQIALTIPSAGDYSLTFWLAERELWDRQTGYWYAMPERLPELLEQWRALPGTRKPAYGARAALQPVLPAWQMGQAGTALRPEE